MGCYEKLCCDAAHGLGRVGRRVAPESASAGLSARNDGQQSFSAAESAIIRVIRGGKSKAMDFFECFVPL
jgi:hypothetical protein